MQVSLAGRQLIYRLLHRDPANRLGSYEGANEIKQHPFFRGINWALVRDTVLLQLGGLNISSVIILICIITRWTSRGSKCELNGLQSPPKLEVPQDGQSGMGDDPNNSRHTDSVDMF